MFEIESAKLMLSLDVAQVCPSFKPLDLYMYGRKSQPYCRVLKGRIKHQ